MSSVRYHEMGMGRACNAKASRACNAKASAAGDGGKLGVQMR